MDRALCASSWRANNNNPPDEPGRAAHRLSPLPRRVPAPPSGGLAFIEDSQTGGLVAKATEDGCTIHCRGRQSRKIEMTPREENPALTLALA
jgi:hypothetical protein